MDHLKWIPKLNIYVSRVNGHRLPTEKKALNIDEMTLFC